LARRQSLFHQPLSYYRYCKIASRGWSCYWPAAKAGNADKGDGVSFQLTTLIKKVTNKTKRQTPSSLMLRQAFNIASYNLIIYQRTKLSRQQGSLRLLRRYNLRTTIHDFLFIPFHDARQTKDNWGPFFVNLSLF
jgi:hypothetical protein